MRANLSVSNAILLLLTVAGSTAAQAGAPFMNLLDYRAALLQARGHLPAQSVCAMDLRVRPALRSQVLAGGHDYSWFIADAQYGPVDRQTDLTWVQNQQFGIEGAENVIDLALQKQGVTNSPWQDTSLRPKLEQFGYYPGFYNLSSFASYQVGPVVEPYYKPDGYVYKVFFELNSPQTDLTSDGYAEFSRRLNAAGFHGDSKVPLTAGWIRFTWNNVIVHAPTIQDAKIAEQVGLDYFGPWLVSHSRGLDAQNPLTAGKAYDWPDFLCAFDPAQIPATEAAYVRGE